jgi:UDP-GlcNAc:undecaprenyl-phosphate GlcNAc-1-phosphate transferase
MDTLQFVPILVVGFAASLGLTPVSRQIAMRLGVVDKPNARKIHMDHKPLMGGLAIYVALALSLLLFSPPQYLVELGALLSGAAFLAFIGYLDDRYILGIRVRLASMVVSALVLILSGIQIRLFNTPLIDWPLTILWVVAITNAVNFLDNMDGLAAGLTSIAAAYFGILALTQGLTLVSSLAAALLGSAVGFANFARQHLHGHMGALVLGFVLAVLGIKLEFGGKPLNVTWVVPILVLALPVFDINLVVWTRILEGRSAFEAGKDHTSHRLMSLGLSQRQTLFALYGGCMFFGALALLISQSPVRVAWRLGLGGIVLLGILIVLMVWIRERVQKRKTG